MFFLSKYLIAGLLPLCCISHTGASDPLALLRRNRYLEAVKAWEKDAVEPAVSEKKIRALGGQAIAYQRLGSLYELLQGFAAELHNDYYKTVAKHYDSPILNLYRGQISYYNGHYPNAIQFFDKVLSSSKSAPFLNDMAKVYRHYGMNEIRKKKLSLILRTKFSTVKWQLLQLDEKADYPSDLACKNVRSYRNKLSIIVRQNTQREESVQNVLAQLLSKSEFAENYLDKGELTQVNFYDPLFFQTASQAFYYLAQLKYLSIESQGAAFPDLVEKFNTDYNLANIYFKLGLLDKAKSRLAAEGTPDFLILKARVMAAEGDNTEAKKLLKTAYKSSKNPEVQRDAGYAYFLTGLDNKLALKLTAKATKSRSISSFYRRNAAVLLGVGQIQKALELYGKGYKIQYRNSVEHIDPEYMTEYAHAIYKSGKMRYDEVIETLYYLQKSFPGCRQMHYCMQGIAAAESNNFANEKIFRKGQ